MFRAGLKPMQLMDCSYFSVYWVAICFYFISQSCAL